MASNMFLYWGSGSPPCMRVMIALEEKGLQGYKDKQISFSKKEHKTGEVLKLNPRGQVPTFRDGDLVLNESMAICDYLESVYANQGTKLIPENQAEKAKVLQRKYEALNLVKKGHEDLFRYYMHTKPENRDEEACKTKKEAAIQELEIWEGYLSEEGDGSFIAGKSFTMADIIVYPCIAFMVRLGIQLKSKFPHLASYYNLVAERPSVKASWPPHWKDSEGPNVLKDMIA